MPVDPDRQRRLEELYHAVLARPEAEREPFLIDACGSDQELIDEVRSFLGGTDSDLLTVPRPADVTGLTIAGFRVIQVIGEGGMGVVYEAEQVDPVRRRVALKLIKPGMDTAQVVARFESERQALALMSHRAIASIYDGGATEDGRPYFAMELVHGEPLTEYSDKNRLTIKERLELFVQVCEGVQHAHQKGIIHRDIKPSNILVAAHDNEPTPKIIDFGVAKATSQRLTEKTLYTQLGQFIGTPVYMSPEQAEMTSADVDTRTDVYSLGVVLYELLSGVLPFDPTELRRAGFEGFQRILRESEPRKPSTRARTEGKSSTESARNRRVVPTVFARELRGDLDWITMKALEKDRNRRYGSPSDLAEDIRRHLRHEPVLASPPSTAYRAGKFVQRHRVGVAVGLLGVALLGTFTVAMAAQSYQIAKEGARADREARTARATSAFLTSIFEVAKPSDKAADSVTARQILESASERIDREFEGEPEIRAALLMTLGEVYLSLGTRSKASALFEQALEIRRHLWGPEHPDVAASLSAVASLSEDVATGERLLRECLVIQRRVTASRPDDLTRTLVRLADRLLIQGKYGEAEAFARDAFRIEKAGQPGRRANAVRSSRILGQVLFEKAQYEAAEGVWRLGLQSAVAVYGPAHIRALQMRENVASAQLMQGRYAEAEASYREIMRLQTPLVETGHPELSQTLTNLGAALYFQGRYAEAEKYYRQAFEIARAALGKSSGDIVQPLGNLGQALDAQGKHAEAIATLGEAVQTARETLGSEVPLLGIQLTFLSDALRHAGRLREAEETARRASAIHIQHVGQDHPWTLHAEGALGRALAMQGRWSKAEPLMLRYASALERKAGVEGDLGTVLSEIAAMYDAWGKPDRAAEYRGRLREALEQDAVTEPRDEGA